MVKSHHQVNNYSITTTLTVLLKVRPALCQRPFDERLWITFQNRSHQIMVWMRAPVRAHVIIGAQKSEELVRVSNCTTGTNAKRCSLSQLFDASDGKHRPTCLLLTRDGPADFCGVYPLISRLSVCVCIYCMYTEASLDQHWRVCMVYQIVWKAEETPHCVADMSQKMHAPLSRSETAGKRRSLRHDRRGCVGVCACYIFLKSSLYVRSSLAETRRVARPRKATRCNLLLSGRQEDRFHVSSAKPQL